MTIQGTIEFDIAEGRKLRDRDQGIDRAVRKANKDNPGWADAAYEKIKEFLSQHHGEFMCEDIRAFAAMDDSFDLPNKGQAWAGPIGQAKRNELIRFVRWGASKSKTGHGHPAAVWIKS